MEPPTPYSQVSVSVQVLFEQLNVAQAPIFTAGMMLLIDMWDARKLKRAIKVKQHTDDIQICIRALRMCKQQWSEADKLSNILEALCAPDELLELVVPAAEERNLPEDQQKTSSPAYDPFTPIWPLVDYSASHLSESGSYLSQLAVHWLSLKESAFAQTKRALILGTWG